MRKQLLFLMVALIVSANEIAAQSDPHFTQYYAYPLWLNPALTGMIDGDYRIGGNYRRQLPGLYSPMITQGITADLPLPHNFGLGATLLNQGSADVGYFYTSGYLSLSYRVHLSKYQILSSSFQLGMINRRIDAGKMQFGNQFNPLIGYDPSLPSSEIFSHQSATSIDGSMGLMYFDGDPVKSLNPFFGVSLYHPTQPDNRFLSDAADNKVPIRYSINGGIRFQVGKRAELIPHVIYQQQGSASELTGGIVCNLTIEEGKFLMLGSTYRLNDAIAPSLGLHLNGLTIGLSYDINTSQVKTVSSSNGGYELSISFTHHNKIPETRFICPRL